MNDRDFIKEYIRVWDDGAMRDAPFITLGLEAVLKDYYGDSLNPSLPFEVNRGERILDLGCGWGRMLKPVIDRGAEAVGLDISSKMLDLTRSHLQRNGYKPVLVRGDGTCLPFQDNSFDSVYSLLVLQHISKKKGKDIFSEIRRILKPGGSAYIRIPGRFSAENLLFSLLQFVSINILRIEEPIRMRFYRIGEIKGICRKLFSFCEINAYEFRPPWNFHTRWTWHYIIIPRRFHRILKKISGKIEGIANGRFGFLKNFGVVLMVRVVK